MLSYCLQEPKYDESYDTIGRRAEDCVLSAVMAVVQTPFNHIRLAVLMYMIVLYELYCRVIYKLVL